MRKKIHPPWASGPGEILRHGLELLGKDSDTNRRLAMICIDNAVELMMKTYLGLPKRITGLQIKRKQYQEFSETFTKLLDALEKHASDKLDGIDLGEIEWYHRLRNELYHQGNGLTVERDKVEVYAELANLIFTNLFGFRLTQPEDAETKVLGEFMETWIMFEKALMNIPFPSNVPSRTPLAAIRRLGEEGLFSKTEMAEIDHFRTLRNEVVHGTKNHKSVLKQSTIDRLRELASKIEKRSKGES